MSCHFPLFPICLHKPIQSRVAALAQEYTLDCRLVDYYNLEPKLCVGLSSTPKLISIFLQAILLHFGVPQSVIHGDSIGATGDAYAGIETNQSYRKIGQVPDDVPYIGLQTEGFEPAPLRKLLTYVFFIRGIEIMTATGNTGNRNNQFHDHDRVLQMTENDKEKVKAFCEQENFPMTPIGTRSTVVSNPTDEWYRIGEHE